MKRIALALLFGLATQAQANLLDRGNGLIYDTDLNITWMDDPQLSGHLDQAGAQAWASSLNYGGVSSGWRLPTVTFAANATQGCGGFNCLDGELGHLFYAELGGLAGSNINTTHNSNYDLFGNFKSGDYDSYWYSTPDNSDGVYYYAFDFKNGGQEGEWIQTSQLFALAVHDGDIGAAPIPVTVPEPTQLYLFGVGLLGLVCSRIRSIAANNSEKIAESMF